MRNEDMPINEKQQAKQQAAAPDAREQVALLEAAIKRQPQSAPLHHDLGMVYYRHGNMAMAEKIFAKAVKLDPALPKAHASLADVLRDTKRLHLAEKGYRYALTLDPKDASIWSELGRLYFGMRRREEAVECFGRAVTLDPMAETAWVRLLDALERTNKLDQAFEALKNAKLHFAGSPGVMLQEAKLLRRKDRAAEAVPLMEEAQKKLEHMRPAGHPFWIDFYYELGQVYDRAGLAEKAFGSFGAANSAHAASAEASHFSRTVFRDGVARIRREYRETAPSQPYAGESPIFLVGFPRSGTTLLDQILSSHPALQVTEEKPVVDSLLRRAATLLGAPAQNWWEDKAYPALMRKMQREHIDELRGLFFAGHGDIGKGKKLVDKLPLNMIHAGFIRQVFPEAKIIMALRHPCDSVLSCFMQRFSLNPAMVNFLDLKDAALLYDEVFSLWDGYNIDAFTIRYEDVVDNFQPAIAGLLEYLGVPWDDAVLEFDKTARERSKNIHTPSYHQVTEKIYTRSRGRWHKYREQMQHVLDILSPHARNAGYTMEAE